MAADLNAVLNGAVSNSAWPASSSATNGTVSAVVLAPVRPNVAHCITGYVVSYQGGAVTGTPTITLVDGASKVIETIAVTSSSLNPLIREFNKSIIFTGGNSATLNVSALGSGVVCYGVLHGHTING